MKEFSLFAFIFIMCSINLHGSQNIAKPNNEYSRNFKEFKTSQVKNLASVDATRPRLPAKPFMSSINNKVMKASNITAEDFDTEEEDDKPQQTQNAHKLNSLTQQYDVPFYGPKHKLSFRNRTTLSSTATLKVSKTIKTIPYRTIHEREPSKGEATLSINRPSHIEKCEDMFNKTISRGHVNKSGCYRQITNYRDLPNSFRYRLLGPLLMKQHVMPLRVDKFNSLNDARKNISRRPPLSKYIHPLQLSTPGVINYQREKEAGGIGNPGTSNCSERDCSLASGTFEETNKSSNPSQERHTSVSLQPKIRTKHNRNISNKNRKRYRTNVKRKSKRHHDSNKRLFVGRFRSFLHNLKSNFNSASNEDIFNTFISVMNDDINRKNTKKSKKHHKIYQNHLKKKSKNPARSRGNQLMKQTLENAPEKNHQIVESIEITKDLKLSRETPQNVLTGSSFFVGKLSTTSTHNLSSGSTSSIMNTEIQTSISPSVSSAMGTIGTTISGVPSSPSKLLIPSAIQISPSFSTESKSLEGTPPLTQTLEKITSSDIEAAKTNIVSTSLILKLITSYYSSSENGMASISEFDQNSTISTSSSSNFQSEKISVSADESDAHSQNMSDALWMSGSSVLKKRMATGSYSIASPSRTVLLVPVTELRASPNLLSSRSASSSLASKTADNTTAAKATADVVAAVEKSPARKDSAKTKLIVPLLVDEDEETVDMIPTNEDLVNDLMEAYAIELNDKLKNITGNVSMIDLDNRGLLLASSTAMSYAMVRPKPTTAAHSSMPLNTLTLMNSMTTTTAAEGLRGNTFSIGLHQQAIQLNISASSVPRKILSSSEIQGFQRKANGNSSYEDYEAPAASAIKLPLTSEESKQQNKSVEIENLNSTKIPHDGLEISTENLKIEEDIADTNTAAHAAKHIPALDASEIESSDAADGNARNLDIPDANTLLMPLNNANITPSEFEGKNFMVTLGLLNETFEQSLKSVKSKRFQEIRETLQNAMLQLYEKDDTYFITKLNGFQRGSRPDSIMVEMIISFSTVEPSHLASLADKIKDGKLGTLDVGPNIINMTRLNDNLTDITWCKPPCSRPYRCFPSCSADCCANPQDRPMRYKAPGQVPWQTQFPNSVWMNQQLFRNRNPYSFPVPCWPGCSSVCIPQCSFVCCMNYRVKNNV